MRAWSAAADAKLVRLYPVTRMDALAFQLKRTRSAIKNRAVHLGLRKNPDSCHRFKKGNTAWNKGTHYVAGGRSALTRFKPGRPACEARNYLPIGSLRICADGYLERKLTDDPNLAPARRWVAVHRLVWEAAHGPIPKGYSVTFKPGRRTTDLGGITVDALELLSRADLMRRNTYHRYPQPIPQLIQLRGALQRQINKRDGREKQNRGSSQPPVRHAGRAD